MPITPEEAAAPTEDEEIIFRRACERIDLVLRGRGGDMYTSVNVSCLGIPVTSRRIMLIDRIVSAYIQAGWRVKHEYSRHSNNDTILFQRTERG